MRRQGENRTINPNRTAESIFRTRCKISEKREVIAVNSFVDEYERQLDDKGRFVIPSKLREKLGSTVIITRSPSDRCLHVYTQEEWEVMSSKLRELPITTDKTAAAFVRLFFGKAVACEPDKQGRITVAKRFIDFAGLKKDIVLVGVNTRLEIWDSEQWESYQDSLAEDIILDGIKSFGLNI